MKSKLNIGQRIAVNLLWINCWAMSLLPHFVLFWIIAPMWKFIIYRVIHYREYRVMLNLELAFPEKSLEERKKIASKYYTVLSEIFISTLVLCNARKAKRIISADEKSRRGVSEGSNNLRLHTEGSSWIALATHFGLYEYLLFWGIYAGQDLIAVYHPLKSPVIDELFKRLRGHNGVYPMPAREAMMYAVKNQKSPSGRDYLLGLIADQNPPRHAEGSWYDFMGVKTLFYEGGEKIALRSGMPATFIYQRRTGRGRYEILFEPVWDGKESVEPLEITKRYVKLLEEKIRETPEMWLWSHNRWKKSKKFKK